MNNSQIGKSQLPLSAQANTTGLINDLFLYRKIPS